MSAGIMQEEPFLDLEDLEDTTAGLSRVCSDLSVSLAATTLKLSHVSLAFMWESDSGLGVFNRHWFKNRSHSVVPETKVLQQKTTIAEPPSLALVIFCDLALLCSPSDSCCQ